MKERWRDIHGYEGLYKVSDLGRIKSVSRIVHFVQNRVQTTKHIKGRIRRLGNKKKHQVIFLYKNNIGDPRLVHRLVLEAFVGPCPNDQECRHFPDRDPTNNKLRNLQWGTGSENNLDKRIHGTNGAKPRVPVRCKHCSTTKLIEGWRAVKQQFCSQKCYHSHPRSTEHKNNIARGLKTAYNEGRR